MPCYRCGARQEDPARGESAWKRGVRADRQVLICPDCQASADWTSELDRCPVCASVRLVRRLGETECRECGTVGGSGGGVASLTSRPAESGPETGAAASGLAAEVERALARVLGKNRRPARIGLTPMPSPASEPYSPAPGLDALSLLDWRRSVFALYARVRAEPDPEAAHALWRAERDRLLATHPQSPIPAERRAAFGGAVVAPYDPALRFRLPVDPAVRPARLEIGTGTDGIVSLERIGALRVPEIGDLDVWWIGGYGGGLFVPVRDGSAGKATYPGGRYVLDTIKGADLGSEGRNLVIDFNFAYNPSCAYDPAWACPLAPPGNVVPVPLNVGELLPQAAPTPAG